MNIFKNIISTSLICGVLVTGCGADVAKYSAQTPEEAINTAFTALRELDMQTFYQCTNKKKEDECQLFSDLLQNKGEAYRPLAEAMVQHLSWEITTIQKNGDTATANVTIHNKDFSDAVGNYIADTIRYVEEQYNMGADLSVLINNIIKEAHNNPDMLLPYFEACDKAFTADVTITLTRIDNTWQIQLDDTLCDSLLGHAGIDNFTEDIEPMIQMAEKFLNNNLKRWGVHIEEKAGSWLNRLNNTVNDLMH